MALKIDGRARCNQRRAYGAVRTRQPRIASRPLSAAAWARDRARRSRPRESVVPDASVRSSARYDGGIARSRGRALSGQNLGLLVHNCANQSRATTPVLSGRGDHRRDLPFMYCGPRPSACRPRCGTNGSACPDATVSIWPRTSLSVRRAAFEDADYVRRPGRLLNVTSQPALNRGTRDVGHCARALLS